MGRTRSKSRTETVATAVAFHDIDFAHLWLQMAAVGWTYKRPRGIEQEWTYMNPNGSAVLVGESAVMEYVIKSGLLDGDDGNEGNNEDEGKEDNDGDKSKDDNEDDDGNKGNEGDKVNKSDKGNERVDEIRASQIDTTAEHSQNTLNDLFGSSSDSDVELSQAAVTRAFDLSPTELEQHHDAAQSLQLL
ncbi:hypothetical protein F441_15131 [Phytophthora nicotianae CJ01A1]|uniref:Uncharacterized protein n=1 Tax=Phytophthora nicotianae CJ01A1 TaxID=1317063 RepID=W2WEB5_PHYNI|nr:hypothetical protein F441_15131 [Phytophthora nicotianae CJ01A1]